MNRTEKIESFEDLEIWQVAMNLLVEVYDWVEEFPSAERYGLTSQLTRRPFQFRRTLPRGGAEVEVRDKPSS